MTASMDAIKRMLCAGVTLCVVAFVLPASAGAYLSTRNITPFPPSTLIVGAHWTSPRYGPPGNQWGDIMPTLWALQRRGIDDNRMEFVSVVNCTYPSAEPAPQWRNACWWRNSMWYGQVIVQ